MNKYIKCTVIAITLFCITTVSCTKEDTQQQNIKNKTELAAFTNLHNQLIDYNKSLGIEPTRGFWKKFWRVVGSDAIGALTGGLAGAIGGSAGAVLGILTTESMGTAINQNANSLTLSYDTDLSLIDSMGLFHNEAIISLYEEDTTLFNPENRDDLMSAIVNLISSDYPNVVSIGGRVLQNTIDSIISVIHKTDDISTAIGRFKIIFPNKEDELDIIGILLEGISEINDTDDIIRYIKGFREIVMDSDISEDSKEAIRAGLSVAFGSRLLWNEEEFETDFETISNNE
jgi:hypothetical protein